MNTLPSAPELPGDHEEEPVQAKPQLIAATESTIPEQVMEDQAEPDELNEHVEDPGDPDGVHAAEQEQAWKEEHSTPVTEPAKPTTEYHRKRKWPIILIIIMLLVAGTFAAYWFGGKKAEAPAPKAATPAQTTTQQPATVATKHYDSDIYTLSFDYPENWAVTDTEAKLTVVSPATSLTTAGGKTASVHTVFTIQNQQTSIAGFPAAGATAVLASEKLTYKQPTTIQRAQTYLSYLSYGTANGLDALHVTGDNGYTQGQTIPQSDVVKGNPLISVTFETCTSSDCKTGTPTPVTLSASDWAKTSVSKQITDLIESIQLN